MLKFFIGLAAILVGLYILLFIYGLSTMVEPRDGPEYWSAVLEQYRSHPDAWVETFVGLLLVASGMSVCIRIWKLSGNNSAPNNAIQRTRSAGR